MDKMNLFGRRFNPDLEKIMEDFLSAVSKTKFKDNIILKGAMNLKAAVQSPVPAVELRNTMDLDFHVPSWDIWEEFVDEIPKSISKSSPSGYKYSVISRRSTTPDKGDSLLIDTGTPLTFEIDMNLSSRSPEATIYPGRGVLGYSIYEMLVDKTMSFFSRKIYRRAKDLYDLYLMSLEFDIDLDRLVKCVDSKWDLNNLSSPLHIADREQLKKAYDKLRILGDSKPDFDIVYGRVNKFCSEYVNFYYSGVRDGKSWNRRTGKWE